MKANSQRLRKKIAREAANLLYSGTEKEYKQAKSKAAQTLQSKFLPTNFEIALELDKLAEENEGQARHKRLITMRKEALKLMQILRAYKTLLTGSVWRGTIHHRSDIDITVYHDEPNEVLYILKQNNVKIARTELAIVTKRGKQKGAFHIYAELPAEEKADIKIVPNSESCEKEKCEIYGDKITGISRQKLKKVLKENPTQQFLPS
ncbi:nucleotidyltransferase domain-containing protein [Candidatus Bathyarchaeota archaeon]|nr:nucleotidyltransferase domain-containing protein [Candidatus Bathyarchaeota archaeon]